MLECGVCWLGGGEGEDGRKGCGAEGVGYALCDVSIEVEVGEGAEGVR